MAWYFILLKDPSKCYFQKIKSKKRTKKKKQNYLQSAAGFVVCLVTFNSIDHAGHHVFETVCSGTAFLFRCVPLPYIRITVLSQGCCKNQAKFVAWKRKKNTN